MSSHRIALRGRLARTLVSLTLALFTLAARPGTSAQAQTRATMGPPAEYLMSREAEVALARSAAPAPVSSRARVLLFTPTGYVEAEPGTNGFTCLVERSWSSPFGPHDDFYNPRLRAPICFNPEASSTNLREYLRRTELALGGHGWQAVRDSVFADIAEGRLTPPGRLAMSYMMSRGQVLGTGVEGFVPHVMFYVPFADRGDIGADAHNGHAMMFEYHGGPFAAVIVPVSEWIEVDGSGRAP